MEFKWLTHGLWTPLCRTVIVSITKCSPILHVDLSAIKSHLTSVLERRIYNDQLLSKIVFSFFKEENTAIYIRFQSHQSLSQQQQIQAYSFLSLVIFVTSI